MSRGFAVIVGLVAWGGLLLQLDLSLDLAAGGGKSVGRGLVDFLSYFTVLTNLLVALGLTLPLAAPGSSGGRFFARPGVRTAIAAAIALVAIVYALLLRQTWAPQGRQLAADVLLHYGTPALFVAFWWLFVPKSGLRWRDAASWLAYPAAFGAYTLVRGGVTGSYPYPFFDAGALGYGPALVNALAVLAGYAAIALAMIGVGKLSTGRPGERSGNGLGSARSTR